MSIPFTQYLRPNGHTRSISILMNEDVETKAKVLLSKGYHFDIEVLSTGMVSISCENNDEVIAIVVCSNDPATVDSVRDVVDSATKTLRERSRNEN